MLHGRSKGGAACLGIGLQGILERLLQSALNPLPELLCNVRLLLALWDCQDVVVQATNLVNVPGWAGQVCFSCRAQPEKDHRATVMQKDITEVAAKKLQTFCSWI